MESVEVFLYSRLRFMDENCPGYAVRLLDLADRQVLESITRFFSLQESLVELFVEWVLDSRGRRWRKRGQGGRIELSVQYEGFV